VTINYKAADKFRFLVGGGLTINNIIFNAIDSVIHPDLDVNGCLSSIGICCTATGQTLGGASSCSWVRRPSEECVVPFGGSFIEFDIHSQTHLTAPPTLTIYNS